MAAVIIPQEKERYLPLKRRREFESPFVESGSKESDESPFVERCYSSNCECWVVSLPSGDKERRKAADPHGKGKPGEERRLIFVEDDDRNTPKVKLLGTFTTTPQYPWDSVDENKPWWYLDLVIPDGCTDLTTIPLAPSPATSTVSFPLALFSLCEGVGLSYYLPLPPPHSLLIPSWKHPLPDGMIGSEMIGSCDGLYCLRSGPLRGLFAVFVWNPTTGLSRQLPPFKYVNDLYFGFGYDRSSKDYKVVKIDASNCLVDVFTLYESTSWKRLQGFPGCVFEQSYSTGAFSVAGCLNWPVTVDGEPMVASFNLALETFTMLPLPPTYGFQPYFLNRSSLWILDGYLSLVNLRNLSPECGLSFPRRVARVLDIWIMREYGVESSWTNAAIIAFPHCIGFPCNLPFRIFHLSKDVLILHVLQRRLFVFNLKENSLVCPHIHGQPDHTDNGLEFYVQTEVSPYGRQGRTIGWIYLSRVWVRGKLRRSLVRVRGKGIRFVIVGMAAVVIPEEKERYLPLKRRREFESPFVECKESDESRRRKDGDERWKDEPEVESETERCYSSNCECWVVSLPSGDKERRKAADPHGKGKPGEERRLIFVEDDDRNTPKVKLLGTFTTTPQYPWDSVDENKPWWYIDLVIPDGCTDLTTIPLAPSPATSTVSFPLALFSLCEGVGLSYYLPLPPPHSLLISSCKHPLLDGMIRSEMIGSCDGLYCLRSGPLRGLFAVFVWNPTAGLSRQLPPFKYVNDLYFGFGYDHSSQDYKVVKIDASNCLVDVFALYNSTWWKRLRGFPGCVFQRSYSIGAVSVAGCLNWLVIVDGEPMVASFNLDLETFTMLPLPPTYGLGPYYLKRSSLWILDGYLSFVTLRNLSPECGLSFPRRVARVLDIWIMREYGVESSWTNAAIIAFPHCIGFPCNLPFRIFHLPKDVLILHVLHARLFVFNLKENSLVCPHIHGQPDINHSNCGLEFYVQTQVSPYGRGNLTVPDESMKLAPNFNFSILSEESDEDSDE